MAIKTIKSRQRSKISNRAKTGGIGLASYRRFSRSKAILLGAAFVAIGIATLIYSRAATVNTFVQAETLAFSPAAAQVQGDGRVYAGLYRNSTATGTFTLKNKATKIATTAKGTQCNGAVPLLEIKVDGATLIKQSVASTTPAYYIVPASIAAGNHTLTVSFANDKYVKNVCDSNLFVDYVLFVSEVADVKPVTNTASVCAIGIHNVEYGGATANDRANSVTKMRAAGAMSARVHMVWPDVQTSRTTYNQARLEQYDDYINRLHAAGMHITIVNGPTPGWAADPNNSFAPRADDYANFLKTMAARYKGKVDNYQVLNEVDHWWPLDKGPIVYTNILKTVYPAIKAADPNATVYMSGLSYDYNNAPAFVKAVYANGGKPYFDKLAMHFYPQPGQDTNLYITNIRQPMVDNGDAAKQIVVTETGRPTAKNAAGAVPAGSSSEADQATFMVNNYKTLLSYPYINRTITFYELYDHDRPGNNEQQNNADPELRFGIYRRDGTAKPVLAALQNLQKSCPAASKPELTATLNVAKAQMYELWNGSEQIYTTSKTERDTLVKQGYADQGLKGSVYASPAPGTSKLYRLYSAQATDHIYTTNAAVRTQAINGTLPEQPGVKYIEEASPGYILTAANASARAFGGTYSKGNSDHMYWTYDWQKSGQNGGGYTDLGVVGYLLNN